MYIIITAFKRGASCKDGDKVPAAAGTKVLQGMGFGLNAAGIGLLLIIMLEESEGPGTSGDGEGTAGEKR